MQLTCWSRRGAALGLAAVLMPAAPAPPAPVLAVLVVVDQLRGDYLDRFGQEFRGGFARFVRDETGVYRRIVAQANIPPQ